MPPPSTINNHILPSSLFPLNDPDKNRDLLLLVVDYLNERGLSASATVLRDEAQLSTVILPTYGGPTSRERARLRDAAVLEGDWEALREMSKKMPAPRRKSFLYAILKQEFLELVNAQESQLAFAYFNRCLKPLESFIKQVAGEDEFSQLLYLTTCKSVRDTSRFQDWSLAESRAKLVRTLGEMSQDDVLNSIMGASEVATLSSSSSSGGGGDGTSSRPTPHRLLSLVQQAYAYQVLMSHAHPATQARVDTLLRDYSYILVPNSRATPHVYAGHASAVKCLTWVNTEYLASGSSDGTLGFWHVGDTKPLFMEKHRAKIWDVACSRDSKMLGCVHADSHVTLRAITAEAGKHAECHALGEIDTKHRGDVYSITFLEDSTSFVTTGFDHTAKQFDVETGQCIKTFSGHAAAVTSADTFGNLVVTGSKDRTVMFFDISSGVCVRTFDRIVGEVTSIKLSSSGERLLVASKDSTHRIFDVRTGTCLTRFKGAVNSSKSFLRASFGSSDNVVLSGSENGSVLVWEANSGSLLQTLKGHQGPVFRSTWNETLGVLASCSDDATVRCWKCDDHVAMTADS